MSSQEVVGRSEGLERPGADTPDPASGRPESMHTDDSGEYSFDVEKPWQDPEILQELYHGQKMTLNEVADTVGCSFSNVRAWMKKFSIDRRGHGEAIELTVSPYPGHPTIRVDIDSGYEYISVNFNGRNRNVYMHRLLAVAKYGFDEIKGKDVHHGSGDFPCELKWANWSDNIELLTRKEHTHKHTALSWEDRLEIERRYRTEDTSQRKLAKDYPVTHSTIRNSIKLVEKARKEGELDE